MVRHTAMISTNSNVPAALRMVVLAAGFSARLGRPKALARVRGLSLIARTLRTLAPFATAPIIVVVPPRAARLRAELRGHASVLIANPLRNAGLSSSVRRGLRHARYEAAVLIVPMDLAHLERRDIARLIARWRGARRRVAARRIGTEGGGAAHSAPPALSARGWHRRRHRLENAGAGSAAPGYRAREPGVRRLRRGYGARSRTRAAPLPAARSLALAEPPRPTRKLPERLQYGLDLGARRVDMRGEARQRGNRGENASLRQM